MLFPLYDHNPNRHFAWLTVLIIAANVAVMGWLSSLGPQEMADIAFRYGFIPKRASEIDSGKPIDVRIPSIDRWGHEDPAAPRKVLHLSTSPQDVYPTFITAMFLHGGWFHLVSNMWMLWVFGNNIEDRLGPMMFAIYYCLGGMLATVLHWMISPGDATPMIGASGAVAAVLGGYAVTYPTAKVRTLVFFGIMLLLDLPALVVLGAWFALELAAAIGVLHGLIVAPVAFWAHVGGFIAGIVLLPFLSIGTSPPENDWRKEVDELFRFEDPRTRSE